MMMAVRTSFILVLGAAALPQGRKEPGTFPLQ